MKKFLLLCSLCAASALFAADGAELFKKCVTCHGPQAERSYLNKVPVLTSVDAAERLELMKAYKAGTLGDGKGKFGMGAVMKAQMASLSDEDMVSVNDYITTLKP